VSRSSSGRAGEARNSLGVDSAMAVTGLACRASNREKVRVERRKALNRLLVEPPGKRDEKSTGPRALDPASP
jgi:hypothetical protein